MVYAERAKRVEVLREGELHPRPRGYEPRELLLLHPAHIVYNQNMQKSKVAILGFGREGQSLLKFLKKSPKFKGAKIKILDQKFNKNYLRNLERFDIIFRSPGVPYTLPQIQKAKKRAVKISSATKLFFELIDNKPKIIGVTGSKGKGTTCTLIYQILKNSGFKAVLAGNIGKPALKVFAQARSADFVVLELSSFQLQDIEKSPNIAIVLDVFPEHLDIHKNLKEYYTAKANIGRYQKKTDVIFYFQNNSLSKALAQKSPAKKFPIVPRENNLRKNFEMAATVAEYLGCPDKIIQKTIKNFKGLEHRLELVRTIKIQHSNILENVGISFYNDSAATNPQTTATAISSFKEPVILIAGGRDAKFNYRIIGKTIKKSAVRAVLLFGENQKKVAGHIKFAKRLVRFCKNLNDAIKNAFRLAKVLARENSSVIILFSPGAKSFDMFRNYADRGKQFKKAVRAIKAPHGS